MTGLEWAWPTSGSAIVVVVEGEEFLPVANRSGEEWGLKRWTNRTAKEWESWSNNTDVPFDQKAADNWWGLLALALVLGTAAGNILVCLAISWERRLQNVTNYFLMSLAITDLMVAVLVMPLGILTLVRGKFWSSPSEWSPYLIKVEKNNGTKYVENPNSNSFPSVHCKVLH